MALDRSIMTKTILLRSRSWGEHQKCRTHHERATAIHRCPYRRGQENSSGNREFSIPIYSPPSGVWLLRRVHDIKRPVHPLTSGAPLGHVDYRVALFLGSPHNRGDLTCLVQRGKRYGSFAVRVDRVGRQQSGSKYTEQDFANHISFSKEK